MGLFSCDVFNATEENQINVMGHKMMESRLLVLLHFTECKSSDEIKMKKSSLHLHPQQFVLLIGTKEPKLPPSTQT